MAIPTVQPQPTERPFGIDELFFSTTDAKGIITAGNSVFRRVAGYEEREMLGQAHNIIRHPDMPRAVFLLLWTYIESGRSIAAYVKNMAKDGSYYWVLATVTPTDGGYLSVRFKPTTTYLPIVQQVYRELKSVEDSIERSGGDRKSAMAASVARLGEILNANGFEDYDAFMRAVLPAEMASRDAGIRDAAIRERGGASGSKVASGKGETGELEGLARIADSGEALGRYLYGVFGNLDAYVGLNKKLSEMSSFLIGLAIDVRRSSLNAVISAAHLDEAGVALGVVASLMRERSDLIADGIRSLSTEIESAAGILRGLAFRTSIARLQTEMTVRFARELLEGDSKGEVSGQDHLGVWSNVHSLCSCLQADFDQLALVPERLARISSRVQLVHDELRVLNVLQINGRVESVRVESADRFQVLFNEIGIRLGEAVDKIEQLGNAAASVQLRRHDDAKAREHLRDIAKEATFVAEAASERGRSRRRAGSTRGAGVIGSLGNTADFLKAA